MIPGVDSASKVPAFSKCPFDPLDNNDKEISC